MEAVDQQLVHRDASLIQLLDPPFDHSEPNPGYVQGYVRGVRENGGQYTHAAVWAAMAFAALGDATRASELVTMINPVNHATSPEAVAVYQTEPYVLAGDVYAFPPHTGRGGWAWYTGSAGWMYQCILESLLGLRLEVDQLYFSPCLPPDWTSFKVRYRFRNTVYDIVVRTSGLHGEPTLTVDGITLLERSIPLADDRQSHTVEVTIALSSPGYRGAT